MNRYILENMEKNLHMFPLKNVRKMAQMKECLKLDIAKSF